MNHISKFLYATENVFDYKDEMIKIMVKVVKETDDVLFNQFGQAKEDIIFFVSMTDDDMVGTRRSVCNSDDKRQTS